MTPQMMLEIALENVRRGAKFLRDDRGVPAFRVGQDTDLLGIFIPQSVYYSTPKIESMNTQEVYIDGIWTSDEVEIINRLDHIQACHDEAKWTEKIQELLEEYTESSSSQPDQEHLVEKQSP
jgi:hypothetical protein